MAAPQIEAWQVFALLGSIALVVLGAYGTLILQNRGLVQTISQRLFGASEDDEDTGFVQDTNERLGEIEGRIERNARRTHTQLYALDQKMDVVLEVVAQEHTDVRLPRSIEDIDRVPPPPGDFYRGGGSPNGGFQGPSPRHPVPYEPSEGHDLPGSD